MSNTELTKTEQSAINLASKKELKTFVNDALPKMMEKAHFFRRDSQHSLSFQTLTMLCGQHPHRILRQITAEVDSRRNALLESAKNMEKMQKKIAKAKSDTAKQVLELQKIELENAVQNSIKDIAVFAERYNQIEKEHGIDNWNEQDFEEAEASFHVRRGFELLYQNLIQQGRPEKSIIEYLQQHGVHPQLANREVLGYIQYTEKEIEDGKRPTANDLEDFLDEMMNKYQDAPKEVSKRIFGTEDLVLTKSLVPTIEMKQEDLKILQEPDTQALGE